MWWAIAQPTTRRNPRSITVARYSHPSQVHTYVMSPAQQTSSSAGWNCRPIRSSAAIFVSGSATVVRFQRRR